MELVRSLFDQCCYLLCLIVLVRLWNLPQLLLLLILFDNTVPDDSTFIDKVLVVLDDPSVAGNENFPLAVRFPPDKQMDHWGQQWNGEYVLQGH